MGAQGFEARMLLEPGSGTPTYDASSLIIPFNSENIGYTETFEQADGMRGTLDHRDVRVAKTREEVGGSVTWNPHFDNITTIFELILFGTAAAGVISPTDTESYFAVLKDHGDIGIYSYTDLMVSRAVLRGTAGGLLELTLDTLGKSYASGQSWPGVPPSIGTTNDWRPMAMAYGALTCGGNVVNFDTFELIIDNGGVAIFRDELQAHEVRAQDRTVTLGVDSDSADYSGVFAQGQAGLSSGSIVFSTAAADMSLTLAFGTMHAPAEPQAFSGKNTTPLPYNFMCTGDGTEPSIKATIDETPA